MYHGCNSYGGDGGSTCLIPHEKIRMLTSTGNATHGDAITALLSKRHQVSGTMQMVPFTIQDNWTQLIYM